MIFIVDKIVLPPFPLSGLEVYNTVNNPEFKVSENSNENFVALNGTIKEIAYYDDMLSNSASEDYEGMSNTGSVSIVSIDKARVFKGKKIALKKQIDTGKPLVWTDLETMLLGFISEITFNTKGVDLKLVGMSKLLDQEKEFTFKKTKRSVILKKIIESAGLKCEINLDGLKDDVTNYSNVSSSGSNSSNVTGEIADKAHEICQNLTSDLEKAKAIWKYCHDTFKYVGYSNSRRGAEGCFKKKGGNCCDHAHVVVEMLRAENIKAAYKHSSSCYGGRGHVWACAYCDGKWYDIDASVKSKGFNEVGQNCTGSRQDSINF